MILKSSQLKCLAKLSVFGQNVLKYCKVNYFIFIAYSVSMYENTIYKLLLFILILILLGYPESSCRF